MNGHRGHGKSIRLSRMRCMEIQKPCPLWLWYLIEKESVLLKETITFEDVDGNSVTEDFYFNLSKSELVEMTLSVKGGFDEYLKSVLSSDDGGVIMAAFKDILAQSVGERSQDGRSFMKSDDYTKRFLQSNAYEELFVRLVTDADYAAKFVNGIVPKDMERLIGRKVEDVKPHEYSEQDLLAMSQEAFEGVVGTDPRKMSREHLIIAARRRNRQPA